jgi:hypothetical protein
MRIKQPAGKARNNAASGIIKADLKATFTKSSNLSLEFLTFSFTNLLAVRVMRDCSAMETKLAMEVSTIQLAYLSAPHIDIAKAMIKSRNARLKMLNNKPIIVVDEKLRIHAQLLFW